MMEYKIEEMSGVQFAIVALPVEISSCNESCEYYDQEFKRYKSSKSGNWLVLECDLTPKNMDVPVKEFKEVEKAVDYARQVYLKFLRDELKRCRFNSKEQPD